MTCGLCFVHAVLFTVRKGQIIAPGTSCPMMFSLLLLSFVCLFISICLFVFHEVPEELQISSAYIFVMFLECFEDLLDDLDDEDFLDEALLV